MKRYSLLFITLCILTLLFTSCKGINPVLPTQPSDNEGVVYSEESTEGEIIELVSKEVDLYEGGIIEVVDPKSELNGVKLIIKPISEKQKSLVKSKIVPIVIGIVKLSSHKLPKDLGYLITPIFIKVTEDAMKDPVLSQIEIPYNDKQLINSGIGTDAQIHVLKTFDKLTSWIEEEQYNKKANIVTIPFKMEELFSYYALSVENAIPPNPSTFRHPLPGDILYKFSSMGPNEGWLPGHVGIYVGEKYDAKNNKRYNVVEAQVSGVERTYYKNLNEFGKESIYLGAREPKFKSSHSQRNEIVAFVENAVGKSYADIETFSSFFYIGIGKGYLVKGYLDRFNCVGLAEAAYESVGIDIVSTYDEGNLESSPFDILTPAEQWYLTVPASGFIDKNKPPVISGLEIKPQNPKSGDNVIVTCSASDGDGDILTYEWTIKDENGKSIGDFSKLIRGKQVDFIIPSNNIVIECKVFDNYGGEDSEIKNIEGITPPSQVQLLSPSNGATVTTSTVQLSWNPVANATGYEVAYDTSSNFANPIGWTVSGTSKTTGTLKDGTTYYWRVRAFVGDQYSSWSPVRSFTKSGVVTRPNPPTGLSPGSTSAPGPTIANLTPKLSWSAVANAEYYNLSVSIYPYGYDNIVFYDNQAYGTSVTIPSGYLQAGQKYRWNIRAYNSAGYSDYSSDYYFQTESNQEVTLILYIYENSLSGPPLSGVSVGVVDGGGNSSNHTTNSSGYVTIKGIPGTWSFSAMKSGYDTNNWTQSITTNCTKYGYLVKSETPVGTIDVFATLDGSPWIGSLSYSLTGPSPSSGSTVPAVFNNKSVGSYNITYNSGGPSNASLSSITPSSTQTLSTGSIIAFTFNFVSQTPSLGQVQLAGPSNGGLLPPMSVYFWWDSVSNATKYQFILYNSQGQVALDTIRTSTSLSVALGTEETITWKVRAGDNSGNWSPWSSTWSLTIKSL
jgi:hypothetical protein